MYIYKYIYTNTHIYIYMYIIARAHTHTHTHTHTYIYIYIYIYIYTYICSLFSPYHVSARGCQIQRSLSWTTSKLPFLSWTELFWPTRSSPPSLSLSTANHPLCLESPFIRATLRAWLTLPPTLPPTMFSLLAVHRLTGDFLRSDCTRDIFESFFRDVCLILGVCKRAQRFIQLFSRFSGTSGCDNVLWMRIYIYIYIYIIYIYIYIYIYSLFFYSSDRWVLSQLSHFSNLSHNITMYVYVLSIVLVQLNCDGCPETYSCSLFFTKTTKDPDSKITTLDSARFQLQNASFPNSHSHCEDIFANDEQESINQTRRRLFWN